MQVEDPVSSGGAEERRLTAKERYLRDAYGAIHRKHAPAKAGGGAIACPPLAGRQSAGGGRAQQMMP